MDRKAGLRWEGLLLGRKRHESVGASQGEGERYRREGGLCRARERLVQVSELKSEAAIDSDGWL